MSVTTHPEAFINCNATIVDTDLCTLDTCCLAQSSFLYRPSYGGNVFFAILFAVFAIPQLWLGIQRKTWGFMTGMLLGLALEVFGYGARVGLYNNPFNNDAFLMYLIMLTIAPVFITAAIYICLSRIIVLYGSHLAPLKPRTIALVFMSSDFLSLVLQAAGGAIAETAETLDVRDKGVNTMIAGLLLQAISLAFFTAVWAWFQVSVKRGIPDPCPDKLATRSKTGFKVFQMGLLFATAVIVVRSIYRVAELWGGFEGELWNNESDFMILDGVMIALAVVALSAFHPGVAFGPQWHTANWSLRNKGDDKQRLGSRAGVPTELEVKLEDSGPDFY